MEKSKNLLTTISVVGGIIALGVGAGLYMSNRKNRSRLFDYYDSLDKHGVRQCVHSANKILNKFLDDE